MKWLKNLTYCFLMGCLIVFSISNDTGFSHARPSLGELKLAINHQTKEYTYTMLFGRLCSPCEYSWKKGWQLAQSELYQLKICPKGFEDAQREFCFSKQGPPKRKIPIEERGSTGEYCPEGYSLLILSDNCISKDRRIKERVLEKERRVCPKGSEEFTNMFCLSISSEGKIKEKKRICPVKYVENREYPQGGGPCIHTKFRNYKMIYHSIKECKKPRKKLPPCCERGDCSEFGATAF